MTALVIAVFIIGYITIVFEHPLKLDKTVPALIMGSLCWAALAVGFSMGGVSITDGGSAIYSVADGVIGGDHDHFSEILLHHIGIIAEILIFLIGAMTIVEIIDLHKGFSVIKSYVKTDNKKKLLWIVGIIAFFLSAIIDNLTATIVLVTILRKLITDKQDRLWYVSLIVIAANAGGAWSPIGDVTTTMLWIGKKVTAMGLIEWVVLPSVACFAIPFLVASRYKVFSGKLKVEEEGVQEDNPLLSSRTMLFLGLGAIIFVPIFKTITHLPPYVGMMLSMGFVWAVSEYIHPEEDFSEERKHLYSAHKALSRIELSSILFFLGILMAVAALETVVIGGVGSLRYAAEGLETAIPNKDIVVMLLGTFSAIIDNVPLVAAAMGMYSFPIDDHMWHFIAYAAGTGGSMLVIGSAAGVAAMGMEKIDFIWYFKNITWLAFLGFVAGGAVFVLSKTLIG